MLLTRACAGKQWRRSSHETSAGESVRSSQPGHSARCSFTERNASTNTSNYHSAPETSWCYQSARERPGEQPRIVGTTRRRVEFMDKLATLQTTSTVVRTLSRQATRWRRVRSPRLALGWEPCRDGAEGPDVSPFAARSARRIAMPKSRHHVSGLFFQRTTRHGARHAGVADGLVRSRVAMAANRCRTGGLRRKRIQLQ